MSDPFGIAQALANLLNMDVVLAGFLIGFAVIVALTVAMVFLLGEMKEGSGFLIPVSIAIVFNVLIGLWDPWIIIFIALIVVLIIFAPFGRSSRSGL